MPTVFITSFHPLISRNIIGTDLLSLLARGGMDVVVLVPDYKVPYFANTYREPQVRFEGVGTGPSVRTKRVGMFKRLAEALPNTHRAALGRKRTLSGDRKSSFYYFLFYLPVGLLGRWLLFHRLVRWLDYHLSPRGRFHSLLDRYRPALVFLTDAQNEHDVALGQDARRRGIRVLAMVRSWDNLTTRALRMVPDVLAVQNDVEREEAITYHGVDPRIIVTVGIPHYDRYLRGPTRSRLEYLREIGADPSRKFIIYIPVCDYRLRENSLDRYVIECLGRIDATVLVRFPPAETVNLIGLVKPPNVIFDQPGYVFDPRRVNDRDLTPQDDERFLNALAACDLVVSGPSTVDIDAALFDKPVILIDFYPTELPPEDRIYEYEAEHVSRILTSGGVRRARSAREFTALVAEALAHPERDRAGREKIRREQCWSLDGRSSHRLAEVLLAAIPRSTTSNR